MTSARAIKLLGWALYVLLLIVMGYVEIVLVMTIGDQLGLAL